MFSQLKSFLMRGSVIDLAVGVIIGAAFNDIVKSLVDKIIMPLIGVITGGVNFKGLAAKLLGVDVGYGDFLQAIVNFVLVGIALFFLLKAAGQKPGPPAPTPSEALLTEIRDLLKKEQA
ncbi:MAG: large conductance mechanosensitive channel protein MscL [Chitinophagales bacterium]|jgi:large conductance mechanosensitive channel|nr:large conductance mechanosensitive channel protein MscL [Chitinophagales bacterium]